MIGVGITYMIIGSPYFLKNKLNLKLHYISERIYLMMFICGLLLTFLTCLNFLIPYYLYVLFCGVVVLFVGFYSLKIIKNFIEAVNLIDKLTK